MNLQTHPTLISILGGNIWNNQGVWHTSGPDSPGDNNGITNDYLRVLASACLYKKNPAHTILLAQGGLEEDLRPSIARVIKAELESLGVPKDHILLEERSHSTFSQLFELKLIVVTQQPMHILIVSNEWHLPRIEAMIQWIPELQELSEQKLQLCAAEEVLLQECENDWRAIIEAARHRGDTLSRIAKEQQGVEQIKAGTYKYR